MVETAQEHEEGNTIRKKKKKGSPSLLDVQKRILKEQQQQQEQHQSKPDSANTTPVAPTPLRRSTRRNPIHDVITPATVDGEDEDKDEGESDGKGRDKKLNFVVKLPPSSLNSGLGGSDSNASNVADAKNRRINAIEGSSTACEDEKAEKNVSAANANTVQGTQLDMGPSTPLPDKNLLLFILGKLQKKDTHGVFAKPVDPEELPDYNEIIERPMDFATVRNKLSGGAYAKLEQFEKDVFLICSNAMQYNSPDTIYFRQARSIQDLAKKNFQNLRQDSGDKEPERKIVRRGRPPTKNFKKHTGRPSAENAGLEFSSDAALATGAENSNSPLLSNDLGKGTPSYKSSTPDIKGRMLQGSFNIETSLGCLAGKKLKGNDKYAGSTLKENLTKLGKTEVAFDESRRNTYSKSFFSDDPREPSVLTTFDAQKKQLIPIGVQMEYGYARSLARFAANLGPVAWKVASKKIEESLHAGINFGPGWVGENDVITQPPPFHSSSVVQASLLNPFSQPAHLDTDAISGPEYIQGDQSSKGPERQNVSEMPMPSTHSSLHSQAIWPPFSSGHIFSNPLVGSNCAEPITVSTDSVRMMNSFTGANVVSGSDGFRPWPVINNYQNLADGSNDAYGLHLPTQVGKLIGSAKQPGINTQSSKDNASISSISTNVIHPVAGNCLNFDASRFLENASRISLVASVGDSRHEKSAVPKTGIPAEPCNQEVPLQTKVKQVPPDLNVNLQSQGSPTSSRADKKQPDLALQL